MEDEGEVVQALDFLGLDSFDNDDDSDIEEDDDEWEGETVFSSDLMEQLSTGGRDLGEGWSVGTSSSRDSSFGADLESFQDRNTSGPAVCPKSLPAVPDGVGDQWLWPAAMLRTLQLHRDQQSMD